MSELIRNSGMYQRLTSSTEELDRLFKEVDEKKSPPDIKKVLLLMGLGTLSWISTYSGLLELIQANSGDIPLTYKLAIGFAVAMLMLMIVYILDQLFAPLNWLLRTIYIFGYIFLTIISVGFGFGFYWKYLESRSEATRSAESAVTQVQTALQGGQSRLEQLESTLITLTALSLQKAKEEREQGNSCPNSRPGDGPRRRLRDSDAKNFSFAGDFVTKRAQAVADDIKILNSDLAKIASRHPSTIDPTTGTRNAFMKNLNQRLDMTITRFNAFRTDPQLGSIRNNLAERSNTTIFPDNRGGTFKCPDNQLQTALRGVVQAIDQLPTLQKPKINASEGSEATIEAFRRLGATLSGMLVLKMPPSEDELREMRKKAVRTLDKKQAPTAELNATQPGLNERDYIPLAIAVFVDLCLLLVSINRPMDRLKSLVPVMKDARDGPISGILSSFHATHFTGIREEFSLFQHVVFDWGGHYYVAVPLASNDIQAQYLANLFVSLEGRGIVDRAMIPPGFIIRSKLKRMGSSFAEHRAFRLYKFRNGAWSNIVMDAVMGAAKDVADATRAEADRRALLGELNDEDKARNANFDSLFESETITIPAKERQTDQDHAEQPAPLHNGQQATTKRETKIAHNYSVFDEPLPDEDDQPLPRLFRNASANTFKQGSFANANAISPENNFEPKKQPKPTRRFLHPAPLKREAGTRNANDFSETPTNSHAPIGGHLSQNGHINRQMPVNSHMNGAVNGAAHITANDKEMRSDLRSEYRSEYGSADRTGFAAGISANGVAAAYEQSQPLPTKQPHEQLHTKTKAPTPFTPNREAMDKKDGQQQPSKDNLINLPLETRRKIERRVESAIQDKILKEQEDKNSEPASAILEVEKDDEEDNAPDKLAQTELPEAKLPVEAKLSTEAELPVEDRPEADKNKSDSNTEQEAIAKETVTTEESIQLTDEMATPSKITTNDKQHTPPTLSGQLSHNGPENREEKPSDHIHVGKITNWYAGNNEEKT
ncbi:MAG: hypothetical protein DHS20C08_25000 [Rhodomicrobium sp.]|nr:MAG: hypothetical protein DHS20C08_25000 [Rhodomicrobium sp.]